MLYGLFCRLGRPAADWATWRAAVTNEEVVRALELLDPPTWEGGDDDPALALKWGTLPEGYCRNYADGATNCPWRFDDNPPPSSPTKAMFELRHYQSGN